MWLTARDDSLLAIPRIDAVKVFDSGGRRNTVVVNSLDFVHHDNGCGELADRVCLV